MKPARIALIASVVIGLSACSTFKLPSIGLPSFSPAAEPPPPGVEPSTAAIARIRAVLLTLRSDPALSARVPTEIAEAEALLQKADASQHDKQNGPARIYIVERKVEQVRALAELQGSPCTLR
eukprot:TRINITY_DN18735_c0_g1_i1.p4 TRINITY_DN18735_c0_g1~~TRINITY_DN18735_c0_g1_i1.p4  ORF type:complete len:123 (+),score=22.15 TRINITY_DN18735_c0_g1_i1:701-1069(+)